MPTEGREGPVLADSNAGAEWFDTLYAPSASYYRSFYQNDRVDVALPSAAVSSPIDRIFARPNNLLRLKLVAYNREIISL